MTRDERISQLAESVKELNTLLDHEASDFGPLKIATTQSHQIQTVLAYLLKVAASDHEAILKEPRAIRELPATQANESNRRSD